MSSRQECASCGVDFVDAKSNCCLPDLEKLNPDHIGEFIEAGNTEAQRHNWITISDGAMPYGLQDP